MDFSKTKVASAAVNHSKLDVSSTHITTASFMTLQPAYYRHMLPGEHIKGSGNVFTRLAPVAVPTYGRCRINQRAFFVPFRTVFPNFNEFIVDSLANNYTSTSIVPSSPIVDNATLCDFFITFPDQYFSQPLSVVVTDPAEIAAGAYDFYANSGYYKFSYYGRLYHKILQSLGYRLIWSAGKTYPSIEFSALPLLCLAKVYVDWYSNTSYLNNQYIVAANQLFKYNDPTSSLVLTTQNLSDIFTLVGQVCYDSGNDVYIGAWDNPVAPNTGMGSVNMAANDITSPTPASTKVQQLANGTPYMVQNSSSNTNIGTSFLHDMLTSMTDYVKRNQLSGALQIDRFLSRFGINLDSSAVNRSIYVGASSTDVDFGSVMQTVNTAGAGNPSNLGDYAGQGIGRGGLDFDFKADEFGLFLVTYSIVPASHLYQGFDRNLMHITRMDFYQPEFDNLGCSAIQKGEVYISTDGNYNDTGTLGGSIGAGDIFGFAPRYYEYKQKSDFVTGDYVSPAVFQGGDAWHLNRMLDDTTFLSVANQTHSYAFTLGLDSGSYDRIFNNTDSDIDKFYLVFSYAAESLAPCKSLFDTYDFEEAGKQLTMDAGGSKVN